MNKLFVAVGQIVVGVVVGNAASGALNSATKAVKKVIQNKKHKVES